MRPFQISTLRSDTCIASRPPSPRAVITAACAVPGAAAMWTVPPSVSSLVAPAADQRGGQTGLALHAGRHVAAAVAQPALVHGRVVARQHAHDASLADRGVRVASDGALAAHGGDVLDLPRAPAEAVGGRRQ